jgi:UDP-glucuronate 4-epimerase
VKKILVTGAAGFIGYHLSEHLLKAGHYVCALDNLNDYYDVSLKLARLDQLKTYSQFHFEKIDIADAQALQNFFHQYDFTLIVHLAAQAGVRYSIENPQAYVQSNLVGFANMLNCVKQKKIEHFVYASTSSVYGENEKYPFVESDSTDRPVSFYAATKKANEVMAYSYAKLYGLPMSGLRFFTVYGPWGRPDMALLKFTNKIVKGEPIEIYNQGNLYRDFTYVDDIVQAIVTLLDYSPMALVPHEIYNIGRGAPVKLSDFVDELERQLAIPAKKIYVDMQPGDVFKTFADTAKLKNMTGCSPRISLAEGVGRFLEWYRSYYKEA